MTGRWNDAIEQNESTTQEHLMRTSRTLAAIALAATLTLAACGSADESNTIDPVEVGGTSSSSSSTPSTSDTPSADADDTPLTGQELEDASAAALAEVGEGEVTEATGADSDDDHVYEVEIDLPNGEDVTVELDQDFGVVNVDR